MKKWILVALAVVLIGGVAFWWVRRGAKTPSSLDDRAVVTAERRDLEISAEAAGLVEPIRVVDVKSKASGEVLRVLFDTGDRVDAGTLLAEIDPRDVQSALAQAEADLQSARVKAQVAESHRRRMQELKATAVVTQEEYEGAVDAAASARAGVVRNEAVARLARERRGDVTIKAPIAGTILTRDVQPGQIIASATSNVSGGTTLFKMADLTEMQVRAKVDESDIGRVAAGLEAKLTVDAYPGRAFVGKVAKVEPQAVVEQNVTLFPVLIRVDNREGLLRPGMNAEVQISIARRADVVAVPSTAVVALKDAVSAAAAVGIDEAAVRAASNGSKVDEKCAATRPMGLSAEDRAAARECFQKYGRGGSGRGGSGNPSTSDGGGPAMLFVRNGDSVEPRRVTLGLSDWEFTEVLDGVQPGDRIVLVSVALLQREQQQATDRLRQRVGGVVPGSGGGAARGGGRR
ncbi:MAG TPA: efflux RND transporter periplasmic adaptor subunit [Myxococcaceae bacterium]|nr:efflux RND transporter periplasmic adaptor subunit [Myxococcaceae bacterium]